MICTYSLPVPQVNDIRIGHARPSIPAGAGPARILNVKAPYHSLNGKGEWSGRLAAQDSPQPLMTNGALFRVVGVLWKRAIDQLQLSIPSSPRIHINAARADVFAGAGRWPTQAILWFEREFRG